MCHIRMNIHGLHEHMDMYEYGYEVMYIHGYLDITHNHYFAATNVIHIVIYTGKDLHASFMTVFFSHRYRL